MSGAVKVLIGLAAVLLLGWLWHGPLGNGAAQVERLERQAQAAVAQAGVPGVSVRMGRDPLTRTAIFSGPANDLQREGLGSQPGLNDLVRDIEGVAGISWAGEGGGSGFPLIAETLIGVVLSYLLGLGLGWLFFGRARRDSYL